VVNLEYIWKLCSRRNYEQTKAGEIFLSITHDLKTTTPETNPLKSEERERERERERYKV
jgi:hypothetical protein